MKRSLVRIASTVIAIPVVLWGLWFATVQYQEWRYIHPWERVARGDSEDRVVALLGRPHRITTERIDQVAWESGHKIDWSEGECMKQFHYIPFSITGEEYDVGFDSSGQAVLKFHVTSP